VARRPEASAPTISLVVCGAAIDSPEAARYGSPLPNAEAAEETPVPVAAIVETHRPPRAGSGDDPPRGFPAPGARAVEVAAVLAS
jgi:hypothetical protein